MEKIPDKDRKVPNREGWSYHPLRNLIAYIFHSLHLKARNERLEHKQKTPLRDTIIKAFSAGWIHGYLLAGTIVGSLPTAQVFALYT